MTAKLAASLLVLFGGLLVAAPLSAHHASRAVYGDKDVTLVGTVTNYEWTNPHIIVSIEVRTNQGNLEAWHAEALPPGQASAAGWTKESLKPGDQVTLTGRPGRNAQHIMLLDELVTSDGRRLGRK